MPDPTPVPDRHDRLAAEVASLEADVADTSEMLDVAAQMSSLRHPDDQWWVVTGRRR